MAKFNVVEKKVQLGLDDIIRFQLSTHCYLKDISVSISDLKCLTLLGVAGEADLSEFCMLVATKGYFKTNQTVRNCLTRMEKQGIIVKTGLSKKRVISLNQDLKVQTTGNILLDYKIFHIGT